MYNTILAIDTSCDDTSVAVVYKNKVLSNVISSQVEDHAQWGGVVPGLAKKLHEERIDGVVEMALEEAQRCHPELVSGSIQDTGFTELDPVVRQAHHDNRMTKKGLQIDAIAVTQGPGLSIALGVGVTKAKELAKKWDVPLIPVDHMEGHLFSSLICVTENSEVAIERTEEITNNKYQISNKTQDPNKLVTLTGFLDPGSQSGMTNRIFPALGVLVSGGHTELIKVSGVGEYEILGQTLDDALGEAFDKVARILGLDYPGGPIVAKLAEEGDPFAYDLPIPMKNSGNLDLSYSGLKTAVLYLVRDLKGEDRVQERRKKASWEPESTNISKDTKGGTQNLVFLQDKQVADICASFQRVAIEALIIKIKKALKLYESKAILLGGGASQNKYLQERLKKVAAGVQYIEPIQVFIPQDKKLFMDNAAMIGFAGYLEQFKAEPKILKTEEEIDEMDREPGRRIASE